MATYLDRILAAHREAAADDDRDLGWLHEQALAAPPCRGFRAAIVASAGLAVIAEVKRRSPSRGELGSALDPAALAASYAAGGATCLSVLTDAEHFGGSQADLAAARSAVELPVLRKDFTVSSLDVCDARLMGADALLLIVAALSDGELEDFHRLGVELGMDVLVEVHDEDELERALVLEPSMIGVNQRDLETFEVDSARALRLAPLIPPDVVRVAESGIRGPADARSLAGAGYDAVLVGEALVTSADPVEAVEELRSLPSRLLEG